MKRDRNSVGLEKAPNEVATKKRCIEPGVNVAQEAIDNPQIQMPIKIHMSITDIIGLLRNPTGKNYHCAFQAINRLIESDAEMDAKILAKALCAIGNKLPESFISYTLKQDWVKSFYWILNAQLDIGRLNFADNEGNYPFHIALQNKWEKVAVDLFHTGLFTPEPNNQNETVLYLCIQNGYTALGIELINTQKDNILKVQSRNRPKSEFEAALAKDDFLIMENLAKNGLAYILSRGYLYKINFTVEDYLIAAIFLKDLNSFIKFTKFIKEPDKLLDVLYSSKYYGWSSRKYHLIDLAAKVGSMDIIEHIIAILEANCEKNIDDGFFNGYMQPISHKFPYLLGYAVENGHLELAKYLVGIGYNVQFADDDGLNLLHLATYQPSKEMFDYLISLGVDIHKVSDDGYQPLTRMAKTNMSFANYLESKGAQVTLTEHKGPLHDAIYFSKNELAEYLIKKFNGSIAFFYYEDGDSLLFRAIQRGNLQMVKFLLSQKISYEKINRTGYSALHACAYFGRCDIASLFLDQISVNHADNDDKKTPLHVAAESQNSSMLRLLLHNGASIEQVDKNGNQAIHFACCSSSEIPFEPINYLLDMGATLRAKNNVGKTPIELLLQHQDFSDPADAFDTFVFILRQLDDLTENDLFELVNKLDFFNDESYLKFLERLNSNEHSGYEFTRENMAKSAQHTQPFPLVCLLSAHIASRNSEQIKYLKNTTVLTPNTRALYFLHKIKFSKGPFCEQFIISDMHTRFGEIRKLDNQNIEIYILDSAPNWRAECDIDLIDALSNVLKSNITLYITFGAYGEKKSAIQSDSLSCMYFAMDFWKRTQKIHRDLKSTNNDLFEYFRDPCNQAGSIITKYANVIDCRFPLAFLKGMQRHELLTMEIVPNQLREQALVVNKRGQQAVLAIYEKFVVRKNKRGEEHLYNTMMDDKENKYKETVKKLKLDTQPERSDLLKRGKQHSLKYTLKSDQRTNFRSYR